MVKAVIVLACLFVLIIATNIEGPLKDIHYRTPWVTGSTIELIEHFEGKRYKAYQDSEGNWTIGVGHLIKRKDHHLLRVELTEDEVMGILHRDLEVCSKALESVFVVGLTRSQIDALHSLCHNIGPDNFLRSDVVKHIKTGNMDQAADAFLNWSKPKVLKNRRNAERALFLEGI
jgi:lysozyme